MHAVAHQLSRIGLDDVERGSFTPEDLKAILTALASIAKDVQGSESDLVEMLDSAYDAVHGEDWPNIEVMCGDCSGSGEGMYEGTRCRTCKGKGVLVYEQEAA